MPDDETLTARPFEILINRKRIAEEVQALGRQITRDYAGQFPVLLGVLKGCLVFLADLMRTIDLPMEIEFVSAASYRRGKHQEDNLLIGGASPIPLKDRPVLIVEGVVDSGRTVRAITNRVAKEEPASVEVVTLIDKPTSHRVELEVKYRAFTLGNEFVIGYGLDNTQRYRNLPYIGRMIES
jgi:hypoxanthine phosphoribosyltransferase